MRIYIRVSCTNGEDGWPFAANSQRSLFLRSFVSIRSVIDWLWLYDLYGTPNARTKHLMFILYFFSFFCRFMSPWCLSYTSLEARASTEHWNLLTDVLLAVAVVDALCTQRETKKISLFNAIKWQWHMGWRRRRRRVCISILTGDPFSPNLCVVSQSVTILCTYLLSIIHWLDAANANGKASGADSDAQYSSHHRCCHCVFFLFHFHFHFDKCGLSVEPFQLTAFAFSSGSSSYTHTQSLILWRTLSIIIMIHIRPVTLLFFQRMEWIGADCTVAGEAQ